MISAWLFAALFGIAQAVPQTPPVVPPKSQTPPPVVPKVEPVVLKVEEEVIVTDKGCQIISLFPAEHLPIANRY